MTAPQSPSQLEALVQTALAAHHARAVYAAREDFNLQEYARLDALAVSYEKQVLAAVSSTFLSSLLSDLREARRDSERMSELLARGAIIAAKVVPGDSKTPDGRIYVTLVSRKEVDAELLIPYFDIAATLSPSPAPK